MRKQRFYLDTSVWHGVFAKVFNADTTMFFNMVKEERIICLYSEVVEEEFANGAPDYVCAFFREWPDALKERLEITPDILKLAGMYISEGVVGKTSFKDCVHIAAATAHNADVLVSWNFKHIVNMHRIRGYNSINMGLGYPILSIYSPKEVINYGN